MSSSFDRAVALTRSLPLSLSADTKLRLYSLYKCYTIGSGPPVDIKPGIWDVIGRRKWIAWEEAWDEVRYEVKTLRQSVCH